MPPSLKQDAVLVIGPWPHPRIAIFTLVCELIAVLNRQGRSVAVLCDGYGVCDDLGAKAICFLDIPADQPFNWRAAFCGKRVYRSLSGFLAEDRGRTPSLLAGVGIIHSNQDYLTWDSGFPEDGHYYDRILADHIQTRTGRRPRLVRTRYDDLQGNLDGFMRLTGIDFVALEAPEREKLLRGEVELAPLVVGQVERHRDLMRSWGWGDRFLDGAIHHAWWRLHQLYRWRYEAAHFDAVVCLTASEVAQNREFLFGEDAQNLTYIHCGISFAASDRGRVDRLLYDYHYHCGLSCYRGAGAEREPVPFARADTKVLFVGRAAAVKGVYELVESLRNLYHSGRRNVRGILVGAFDSDLRRELAGIDPENADDYLLFTGPVEDVDVLASLFAFGDVTAIPSHYEPFCLVGLESFRMGTPCVVTEGTGAGEVYLSNPRRHDLEIALPVRRRHRDGVTRYYGVDVESLTEQLAYLIDHPHVAGRMAEDGERFVREQYSAERQGATYGELYDLLLDGGPASRLYG